MDLDTTRAKRMPIDTIINNLKIKKFKFGLEHNVTKG